MMLSKSLLFLCARTAGAQSCLIASVLNVGIIKGARLSREQKNKSEEGMRVAVDAMGGDFGPRVTVDGALKASRELDIEILLVGVENLIKKSNGGAERH